MTRHPLADANNSDGEMLVPKPATVRPDMRVWDRAMCLALSQQKCVHCIGFGLRHVSDERSVPCKCVYRAVFRACLSHFEHCASDENGVSRVNWDFSAGGQKGYSRRREEYMADFVLVAKRELTSEQHTIFRFHYLLGANYTECCKRLGLSQGKFFREVYLIQQRLGLVYGQLRPYRLYPTAEYYTPWLSTPGGRPLDRKAAKVPQSKPQTMAAA